MALLFVLGGLEVIATISRNFKFSSAHRMGNYAGKCSKIHGHNYHGYVTIKGSIDSEGYIVDISVLKKYLAEVEEMHDHAYLNELDLYENKTPSVENISREIFRHLKDHINEEMKITLYETENNFSTYGDFL